LSYAIKRLSNTHKVVMHEIKVLQNGFVGKISGIIFDYSDLNRKLLPSKQKNRENNWYIKNLGMVNFF
jgi:hypothetical protein